MLHSKLILLELTFSLVPGPLLLLASVALKFLHITLKPSTVAPHLISLDLVNVVRRLLEDLTESPSSVEGLSLLCCPTGKW
jgi:uncharacterized membrane protein